MSEAPEATLNGLHPDKLEAVIASLKEPDVLKAISGPWRARMVWEKGFKHKGHMRTHTIEYDEIAELDTQDTAHTPGEALLAAVGGCMMVGFVLNATRQGVTIHDLEIAVEGNFNNLGKWLEVSDEGHPGYNDITAKVYVRADADEETLQDIWRKAVEGSPVAQTVCRGTPLVAEFEAL